MEPIIGLNSTPKDKWGFNNTNVYKHNGMTIDEYVEAQIAAGSELGTKQLKKQFWAERDKAVNESASVLQQIEEQSNPDIRKLHGYELGSILRNSNVANVDALIQVQGASEQWKKLDRAISGMGGTVLGYDIETFGDTSGRNGVFGITEFGIGKTVFEKNGTFKQSGHSLVIGLDKTETEYATGILNKFKESGWDVLDKHEQVTLKRMSMYGGDESSRNFKSVFSKQYIEELGGEFYTVNKLTEGNMVAEQIERGIKYLSDVYQDGATRENVLRPALEYLYNSHEPNTSSKGWVITGANTKFDTGTIERYAKLHGIDISATSTKGKVENIVDMLKHDTVDLVYGARSVAALRGMSVSEYQKQFGGRRGGGASVQSQLDYVGLSEIETHLSISDINQQTKLFAALEYYRDEKGSKTLTRDVVEHFSKNTKHGYLQFDGTDEAAVKRYDAKNSVFLLNRGWLDKNNGKDFALIRTGTDDGGKAIYEATQNYTVTGQYWELDTEHTGYADGKYILSLKSTADDTIISKQFDSTEEMGTFLRTNADWFERNNIINRHGQHQEIHAEQQAITNYQDRGRREFERAMDPASVSTEYGRPAGGFVDMQQMLEWHKASGGKYAGTPEGFREFVKDEKARNTFNINKANSMQAYLGAQEKIAEEYDLLSKIAKEVDAMQGADNMTKTIAFRKAYESAIGEMKKGAKLKSTSKYRNLIANDVFGVDVDLREQGKNISRINTHSVEMATRDVSRIFSGLKKDDVVKVLEDFNDRGILDDVQTKEFTEAIRKVGIDAGGDAVKARRIGEYLKSDSSYQLYTDIAYALHNAAKIETENNIIVKGKKQRKGDAPKFTLESFSENLYAYSHLEFKGKHNVNSMYGISDVQQRVDRAIADSIASTPTVNYYNKAGDMRKQLQELGARLNYAEDISSKWIDNAGQEHSETLLEQMFYAGKWVDKDTFEPSGYNISQHRDIHTLIVQPKAEGSAYMLFTNDANYGRLMDAIANPSERAFESFSKLRKSNIAQYAGIYELPYIQRYTIEENIDEAMQKVIGRSTIDLTVVKQGESSEKFLTSSLNVYEQGGKMNAYINNGVYDLLTAWRMDGGNALPYIKEGEFDRFTSSLRKQQNSKLKELSGSSSYRGYITESGKVVRMTNYGPGDYMYAYQMRMTEGLHNIFTHGLTAEVGPKMNDFDRMVDAFAEEFGEYHNTKSEGLREFRQRISRQSYFEEFFAKNLFLGSVAGDPVIRELYADGRFNDKTIFDMMLDVTKNDTANMFNDNVYEALTKIKDVYVNQINSVTAMEKGMVTIGIKPGEYDVNAFLYSTMRPTYLQQNLGRSFNPETEWNMDLDGNALQVSTMGKVSLKDGSQLRILKTITGSPEVTIKEHLGKMALANYQPGHGNKVRHIMTSFKQMNDYDLQMKYKFMSENAATLSKRAGLTEEQFKQYLAYMREDMLSVNEGKWFMDPLLGEQRFIRTNDAKKVFGFHIDDIDKTQTMEILEKLEGKELSQNTVIGISGNGKKIYYDGPKTVFTKANIEELMRDGETRVIPKVADIIDAKVMFNGSEKATAHAMSVTAFMKYADAHGIAHGTRHETTMALSRMFNILSDEAGFIGTQELEKHSNLSSIDSLWRTITTNYVQEGKGQALVNYLNTQVQGSSEFAGVKPFSFQNGVIVSNTSEAANPVQFITKVWNDVQANQFGNKELNERIVNQVQWMREHNILFGSIQFQNQNEHVSDGIAIDKRMEQGIRERILSIKNGGERWDLKWAKELNEYSQTYNAKGSAVDSSYRNVQEVFNYFNQEMNIGRTVNMQKRKNMERGIYGIIESLVYYHAPEKYDNINEKNIVQLKFQDLMDSGVVPKNGVSVDTLHSTLFFEDGKPSELLSHLAEEQSKSFGSPKRHASYTLYIDLGGYSIKSADGKGTMNGFLIPIQTAITGADTTMFQTQQKIIAGTLSKIEYAIKNPGERTTQQINAHLSGIVGDMYNKLLRQLAAQNKDSDLYKTFQRQFMPNSGGLLAEQELGPLFTELTEDTEFVKAVETRNRLEVKIANRDPMTEVDTADLKELNEQYEIIKKKSESLAERIRGTKDANGNWIKRPEIMNFTALKGTALEGLERQIMDDGTAKYSFIAATSKKAFEEQGFNFGKFGMDILYDYEANNGKNIPTINTDTGKKTLYSEAQLKAVRQKIMDSVNADKELGIKITSSDTMVSEINEWFGKKYNIKIKNKKLDIDTETLNNDIANNGPISRLFRHFDSVGEDYMKTIGTVGELVRYPTFRSQLASRFILSDHIESNQVIMFNPITSSLTNVDFDGDLMYSIFKLNGGVPFLNGETYDISKHVYETGLDHIPDLLAELVEGGNAIKSNIINNDIGQMAAMLEKFNPEAYSNAIKEYMEDRGLADIEKGSAEEFAARTSRFMQNAFFNAKINTLTDVNIQKASIAPVLRKANIGRISTPNFTVRHMVIGMQSKYQHLADSGVDGAKQTLDDITTILSALTNMKSKKGGLLDAGEQTGIDTKHVWDAMTTAQTARYSVGVNMLFGRHAKSDRGTRERALTHIVSGLYNTVFTDSQKAFEKAGKSRKEGIAAIVKEVLDQNGSLTYFSEETGKDIVDRSLKHGLSAMLAIQNIDEKNNLSNLKRFFANPLNQGRTIEGDYVYTDKAISEMMETLDPKYAAEHKNTYFDGLVDVYVKAISDRSLQVTKDKGYVKLGSVKGDYVDYVYSLKDSGIYKNGEAYATFEVLKYNRSKNTFETQKTQTFKAINNYVLNEKIGHQFSFNIDHNTASIRNFKNDASAAIKIINREKQGKLINEIVMSKKRFASTDSMLEMIDKMDAMEQWHIDKFGTEQFTIARGLFGNTASDTVRITKRTSELGKVYEYAASKGLIGTKQIEPNTLIKSINSDIAAHPERYAAKTNDTYSFSQTFDKILEDRFIADGIFDSVERIETIRKEMIQMEGFDTSTYEAARNNLRESVFDVRSEVSTLTKQYTQLGKDFRGSATVTQALEAQETAIINFSNAVMKENRARIDDAEKQIYSLFRDRKQMDTFFGLDKQVASNDTMVGFGEYIGFRFDELSRSDIFRILTSASEYSNASAEAKYAMERTTALLKEWSSTIGTPSATSAMTYKTTSGLLDIALKEVDNIREYAKMELDSQAKDNAENITGKASVNQGAEQTAKAKAAAGEKVRKKSLTNEVFTRGKKALDDLGIKGRHVGIAAAGMAALGVVNNLLHNQKTDSPLTPARKPNGKGSPDIDGNYPQHPHASGAYNAPRSVGNKVVYHDQQSGLNFRVNAKTMQNINPRQQGTNISTATGGSANVNVYQDNSGVTDNWLANKFAELS